MHLTVIIDKDEDIKKFCETFGKVPGKLEVGEEKRVEYTTFNILKRQHEILMAERDELKSALIAIGEWTVILSSIKTAYVNVPINPDKLELFMQAMGLARALYEEEPKPSGDLGVPSPDDTQWPLEESEFPWSSNVAGPTNVAMVYGEDEGCEPVPHNTTYEELQHATDLKYQGEDEDQKPVYSSDSEEGPTNG